jgi:hypothetical protein
MEEARGPLIRSVVTLPINPTEPTEPIDPTDPTEPIDPIEPIAPVAPVAARPSPTILTPQFQRGIP